MKVRQFFRAISIIRDKDNSRTEELWQLLFGENPDAGRDFLEETKKKFKLLAEKDIASRAYSRRPLLPENPNPRAKIAFILQHPFQYYIYKNVYRHIAAEAEFVIETRLIRKNVPGWFLLLRQFADFLNREKVYFRFFSSSPHDNQPEDEFFRQYTTLVAHYALFSLKLACNEDKRKIRMMYGQSKDAYDFGPWLSDFDLSLNYGPYSQRYAEHFVKSAIVGNPKFDDWFLDKVNLKSVRGIQKKLNPKKPTVLYLPTHGNLSSLEWIAPAMPSLLGKYNIVAKLHHHTLYNEPGRKTLIDSFLKQGVIIADDFTDLLPLLKIADAVLLDNSGAIFDAVLAEKPIVLIDFLDERFLKEEQWREVKKRAPTSWNFPLTYEYSIEQRIKREKNICPGIVVRDAGSIAVALGSLLTHPQKYKSAQKRLRKMLFSYNDGKAGERAAALIKRAANEPVPQKTFFAISARAEYIRHGIRFRSAWDWLHWVIRPYLNLDPLDEHLSPLMPSIRMPTFSVVIPTYNRADSLRRALDALANQKGVSGEEYEVLVIDDASADKTQSTVESFMKGNPSLMMRYIKLSKNAGPAQARNVGIVLSRGEFVCFTDDDAEVPSDWLAVIKEELAKNPEIAGVGGWRIPFDNNRSVFAQFKFYQDLNAVSLGQKQKSSNFFFTAAGDTASICYRKSALAKVGGFNPSFRTVRAPALEDWDLKLRLQRKAYSLAYTPRLLVRHEHPSSFREFIKRNFIRGWGYFLLSRLYSENRKFYNYYNYTFLRALRGLIGDFSWISETKIARRKKAVFALLAVIQHFIIWASKYWGVYRGVDN